MKQGEQLKVKDRGSQPLLRKLIETLEQHYVVINTSRFIEHSEDEFFHIFLTLLKNREVHR